VFDDEPVSSSGSAQAAPGADATGSFLDLGRVDVLGLAKKVAAMLQPADPLRLIQIELAKIELAERLTAGKPVCYRAALSDDLVAERNDVVILGPRGSGKTALAVSLAQRASEARQVPIIAVDVPDKVCAAVGMTSKSWKIAQHERDAVILLDELRVRKVDKVGLWSVLALARQRNLTVISTAQSTAAVTPDVYRLGPSIVWTGADVVSAAFEREELSAMVAKAAQLLAAANAEQIAWPAAVIHRGAWLLINRELPNGWSEEVSKLWG
jgi:hypothetical protein